MELHPSIAFGMDEGSFAKKIAADFKSLFPVGCVPGLLSSGILSKRRNEFLAFGACSAK